MSGLHILLIGCGKMGAALLESWAGQNTARYAIDVVDHHDRLPSAGASAPITHYRELKDVPAGAMPDIVFFAVKPQSLSGVLAPCFARFGVAPLYLSIAAGKRIAYYQRQMSPAIRFIRAMPNTPALIGRGVTVMTHSDTITEKDARIAQALLEASGVALWLEDENKMDVVTAISGSGPAYVFYFMECLMRTALDHGLEEDMARTLVMHTMLGSSELAFLSHEPLSVLRRNVTSPGGTTEAALEYLMNPSGMLPLVQQAVDAAIARAGLLNDQK